MKPPNSYKEVQKLTGCLATLNRLISKSGERNLPFFKNLRHMSKEKFHCDEECSEAFEELKRYFGSLKLLSRPELGERLQIYLAISDVAVSIVLLLDVEGIQKPVYYVSHVLRDAEKRYPTIDKGNFALSCLISELLEGVYVEVCDQSAYKEEVVKSVMGSNTTGWRDPINKYLTEGILPSDSIEAKKVRSRSFKYQIYQGELYRKSWDGPLLTCMSIEDVPRLLAEIREGWCGSHIGARSLAIKITRAGYYWPTLVKDAIGYVKKCNACQWMGNAPQLPTLSLTPVVSPIPFTMWGIDLVGKLPKAQGQVEFTIVAVDYFSKRVEAAPLKKTRSE
ncbi:hypothetical protein LIER_25936 [Lithospermum erythrorhizon]|uniref:Polyprotein n=1 Tax=Lithospermum erythrorhizon TaxID=34254 RepID=A0AAV3R7X1_LITER